MSKFSVGEIAIYVGCIHTIDHWREYVGQECIVIELGVGPRDGEYYGVELHNGKLLAVYEQSLRKRRPPIPPEVLRIFDTVREEA